METKELDLGAKTLLMIAIEYRVEMASDGEAQAKLATWDLYKMALDSLKKESP